LQCRELPAGREVQIPDLEVQIAAFCTAPTDGAMGVSSRGGIMAARTSERIGQPIDTVDERRSPGSEAG
jgi:hypothetical protein